MTREDLHPEDVEAVVALATAIEEAVKTYTAPALEEGLTQDRMSAVIGSALSLVIVRMGELADPMMPSIIISNLGGSPFFRAN